MDRDTGFQHWLHRTRGLGASANNWGTLGGTANTPPGFVRRRPEDSAFLLAMPAARAPPSGQLPQFQRYGRTFPSAGNGGPFEAPAGAPSRFVAPTAVRSAPRPMSNPVQYAPGRSRKTFASSGTHQFTSASHREGATGVPSGSVPPAPLGSRRGPSEPAQRAPPAEKRQSTMERPYDIRNPTPLGPDGTPRHPRGSTKSIPRRHYRDQNTAALYHVLDVQKSLSKQLDILYHDACICETACATVADLVQKYTDPNLPDEVLALWGHFYKLKLSLAEQDSDQFQAKLRQAL